MAFNAVKHGTENKSMLAQINFPNAEAGNKMKLDAVMVRE